MPFESSWPLVVACLLGAVAACVIWTQMQARGLLVAAAALARPMSIVSKMPAGIVRA